MYKLICNRIFSVFYTWSHVALVAAWFVFFLTGVHFASESSQTSAVLIQNALLMPLSAVDLFCILIVPVMFSAIFILLSAPVFLIPVVSVKAFSVAFSAFAIIQAFRHGGWLICFLLLFSSICSSLPLLWFMLRHIKGGKESFRKDLVLCSAATLMIGCIDYFLISPFLVSLANIL